MSFLHCVFLVLFGKLLPGQRSGLYYNYLNDKYEKNKRADWNLKQKQEAKTAWMISDITINNRPLSVQPVSLEMTLDLSLPFSHGCYTWAGKKERLKSFFSNKSQFSFRNCHSLNKDIFHIHSLPERTS